MKSAFLKLKKRLISTIYNRVKPPNIRGYYGQFGEDTAIQTYFISKMWNETKNYEVKSTGFYVDIGAFSPILISNTYWFYQHGWQGINVEPFPSVIKNFNELRPRDINVSAAIGNKVGAQQYFTWGNSNLNTFSDEKAAEYIREGKVSGNPDMLEVEMISMETLFDRHLPRGRKIDFLSVDVEGMDLEVLSSNNWKKYRPELVAVELDPTDINEVVQSVLYAYMLENGYKLFYWMSPAIIFVNVRKLKPENENCNPDQIGK
jgi:FkbM family methyltransferase